jgi:hypothetical protein
LFLTSKQNLILDSKNLFSSSINLPASIQCISKINTTFLSQDNCIDSSISTQCLDIPKGSTFFTNCDVLPPKKEILKRFKILKKFKTFKN